MSDKSVDYGLIRVGIDLGTTNSEIATSINDDNRVEIVKNTEGDDYTPSLFAIDRGGNYLVGKNAKGKLCSLKDDDHKNAIREVKRLMGFNEKRFFSRIDKELLPEDISAEILKSLRSNVLTKKSDAKLFSAVITVPAYFETPQNEATKRAGHLAGFEYVELLQEPVAAAIAYGCDKEDEDSSYLVFDFGGGTFDAAVVSSRNKVLNVVNHGGDNFLGGKDIDKAICDEVIIPALKKDYSVANLSEGAENILKFHAEQCKIALTSSETYNIVIEDVGNDDNGKEIYLNIEYSRTEFNKLIEPIIDKAIDKAEKVIKASGVSKNVISKVILVGGPTQIPYLRQRVEKVLGIPVDTSVDPLTTVARGACIYALSRRVPEEIFAGNSNKKEQDAAHKITLNYQSTTPEDEELVTGRVELPNDGKEYFIQISADNGYYNSQKIIVKDGTFFDTVSIKPNATTRYWVYLIDDQGNNLPVFPDSFSITHGPTIGGMTTPRSVGVIYYKQEIGSNGEYEKARALYFGKNSTLPLEHTESFRTIEVAKAGEVTPLQIDIYGDDYEDVDLYEPITSLELDGSNLPYDLPKGTPLDITIKIDESGSLVAEAYIPSVDISFDARTDLFARDIEEDEIRNGIKAQKQRISEMKIDEKKKKELRENLREVENNISSASDTDTKQKAKRDLKDVTEEISELENSQSASSLADQLKKALKDTKEFVDELGDEDGGKVKERLSGYVELVESKVDDAIAANDEIQMKKLLSDIEDIRAMAITENPRFWVAMYLRLSERPISDFNDSAMAKQYLMEADMALRKGDINSLKSSVRALLKMLPENTQNDISNSVSGVTR